MGAETSKGSDVKDRMVLWFLRLFATFRDLEARYSRLQSAVGTTWPPTTHCVADALGVCARAVLPAFIRCEVVTERSPGVPLGSVRIILQENGTELERPALARALT